MRACLFLATFPLLLLSGVQCTTEPIPLPEAAPVQPTFGCPPDVFPLLWEDFDHFLPGPFLPQTRRWMPCDRDAAAGGLVRRTETNGYLVLEHPSPDSSARPPCLLLPLGGGPGLLYLNLWIPRGAQGRVGVLPVPFADTSSSRSLSLVFRPDRRMEGRLGRETIVLEYAQEVWMQLVVQEDPRTGVWSAELRYQGHDGNHYRRQAIWTTSRGAFGALLLDAAQPGAKLLVDGIFFGWGGSARDCKRAENE